MIVGLTETLFDVLIRAGRCRVKLNTISDILDENREACDCPIDFRTEKAQKSMKDVDNSIDKYQYQ